MKELSSKSLETKDSKNYCKLRRSVIKCMEVQKSFRNFEFVV